MKKANVSIPQNCFLHKLIKLHGRQIWKDNKNFLYTWDNLHGHVEKFSRNGKTHLCVMDINGKYIKGADGNKREIQDEI